MASTNSLKEAICENLFRILSADKNVRENAEQQLSMLETNEDYCLHLMEISLSENLDFSIQHLASVVMDRYIAKHWSSVTDKFEQPEINSTIKQLLREYLLKSLNISGFGNTAAAGDTSLNHNTKKLLNSYAHIISQIAQFDYPHHWPQLFPVLIEYLASGSPSPIYSSLKVFKELSHEITDTQIPTVAPLLLPHMLNIFISSAVYSLRTRSNAIKIFVTISETIIMMNEYQKDSIKQFLVPHMSQFAEAVINILMIPDGSPDVDIGLKKEIVTGLTKFIRHCRKYMKVYLPKIMELIWHSLTTSANIYVQRVVNSNSFDGVDSNDAYSELTDSDGESIGFESYLYAILDFVLAIFESAKFRELIKPVLSELLYYILFYCQITDEQAEIWQSNLDQFIEDDDVDTHAYSVRISAQDLILNLARDMTTVSESSPKKDDQLFKVSFLQAINRHFSESAELEKRQKESGIRQTWWKAVECCLYTLGSIAPTIIHTINNDTNQELSNQFKVILDNVLSNTNFTEPFLAGRSIWTASRFSQIMNDQSLDNFLKMTASVLTMVDAPILRIYALRSTYHFCDNVQVNQKVSVIKPYLNQFLQGLVSIGMQSNSDSLYLVLQTIEILLKLDKEFTSSVAGSICTLATNAFMQYPDDPTISDVTLDLYNELFKIEQCAVAIQEQLLPPLVSILNASQSNPSANDISNKNDKLASQNIVNLQPHALDILSSLVRQSPLPLSDVLIRQVYPALIRCLMSASKEDSAILQNGTECIRFFVANGAEQLIASVDHSTNQNGINLALNVCNNLLNPQVPESCSMYIGRLIITLIMKANQVIGHDNIQHLLRSTLVKLNTSKELVLTQSLILVFAHLVYIDMSTILIFLNSLPAPDGTKSALEFVLNKWLGIQRYFNGYENKASTVALCRLFQHSLHANQPHSPPDNSELSSINLHRIEVACDDEFDMDGGSVRTRSKSAQSQSAAQPRQVPSTVKILKLLLNELRHLQELKEAENDPDSDSDDDYDDDDDSTDESSFGSKIKFGPVPGAGGEQHHQVEVIDLNELLAEEGDDDWEDEDEILSEEISNIELEEVLRTVLVEFRVLPFADQFFQHMTATESQLLKSLQ